jgi:hypothetical protein
MRIPCQRRLWFLGLLSVLGSACAGPPAIPGGDDGSDADDDGMDDGETDTGDGDGDGDLPPLPEPAPPRILFEERVDDGTSRLQVVDVSGDEIGDTTLVEEVGGLIDIKPEGIVTGYQAVYWVYRDETELVDLRLADLRDLENPTLSTLTAGLDLEHVTDYLLTPYEDRVVFLGDTGDGIGVYVNELVDGKPSSPHLLHLFSDKGGGHGLIVSNDGQQVAFAGDPDEDGFDELAIIDLRTYEPLVVSRFDDRATVIEPIRFSPDDSLVFFEANPIKSSYHELFLADTQGRGQRKINDRPDSVINYPTSSPDATRWAYTEDYSLGNAYVVTLDGYEPGDAERINHKKNKAWVDPLVFAHDGLSLLFTEEREGSKTLSWVDVSGEEPSDSVPLHGSELYLYDENYEYTADGSRLFLGGIDTSSFRGRVYTARTEDLPGELVPVSPFEQDVGRIIVSPDSATVAYQTAYELFTITVTDQGVTQPKLVAQAPSVNEQITGHGFAAPDVFFHVSQDLNFDLHLWASKLTDGVIEPVLVSSGFSVYEAMAIPNPYSVAGQP